MNEMKHSDKIVKGVTNGMCTGEIIVLERTKEATTSRMGRWWGPN